MYAIRSYYAGVNQRSPPFFWGARDNARCGVARQIKDAQLFEKTRIASWGTLSAKDYLSYNFV